MREGCIYNPWRSNTELITYYLLLLTSQKSRANLI